jgi:hypothetical protein
MLAAATTSGRGMATGVLRRAHRAPAAARSAPGGRAIATLAPLAGPSRDRTRPTVASAGSPVRPRDGLGRAKAARSL